MTIDYIHCTSAGNGTKRDIIAFMERVRAFVDVYI